MSKTRPSRRTSSPTGRKSLRRPAAPPTPRATKSASRTLPSATSHPSSSTTTRSGYARRPFPAPRRRRSRRKRTRQRRITCTACGMGASRRWATSALSRPACFAAAASTRRRGWSRSACSLSKSRSTSAKGRRCRRRRRGTSGRRSSTTRRGRGWPCGKRTSTATTST